MLFMLSVSHHQSVTVTILDRRKQVSEQPTRNTTMKTRIKPQRLEIDKLDEMTVMHSDDVEELASEQSNQHPVMKTEQLSVPRNHRALIRCMFGLKTLMLYLFVTCSFLLLVQSARSIEFQGECFLALMCLLEVALNSEADQTLLLVVVHSPAGHDVVRPARHIRAERFASVPARAYSFVTEAGRSAQLPTNEHHPGKGEEQSGELASKCSLSVDAGPHQMTWALEPLNKEQEQVLSALRQYYDINATSPTWADVNYDSLSPHQSSGGRDKAATATSKELTTTTKHKNSLPQLPRPSNLSVLIISWYPPVLKLSWNLNEPDFGLNLTKLNFHRGRNSSTSEPGEEPATSKFDLELALAELSASSQTKTATSSQDQSQDNGANENDVDENDDAKQLVSQLRELKLRRSLIEKSLTCFQVTYNVVSSR